MTHRAHRDHLDHGWTRSPLTDPPPWGESLPDEWLDVELNFYRITGDSQNNIGGFVGTGVQTTFLIINGKAEIEVDMGVINTTAEGTTEIGAAATRHYSILIPMPDDLSTLPKAGDRVWFYDALNRRIDMPLREVAVPEGIADHVEIISEDIE